MGPYLWLISATLLVVLGVVEISSNPHAFLGWGALIVAGVHLLVFCLRIRYDRMRIR